jgi:hypothetical protein
MGVNMKAVLEFHYPEDERKLLFALKGNDMHSALIDIKDILRRERTMGGLTPSVLAEIEAITDEALKEMT